MQSSRAQPRIASELHAYIVKGTPESRNASEEESTIYLLVVEVAERAYKKMCPGRGSSVQPTRMEHLPPITGKLSYAHISHHATFIERTERPLLPMGVKICVEAFYSNSFMCLRVDQPIHYQLTCHPYGCVNDTAMQWA